MGRIKKTVYHGTTEEAAENIIKTQEVWDSRKNDEWLGSGAYFFAYPGHAFSWIVRRGMLPGKVVQAELEFDEESLLDLDDPEQMKRMNQELVAFSEKIGKAITVELPQTPKELWRIWCWGCNTYRALHKEICIISYTFPQRKHYSGTGYHGNERQLCISDHKVIKNISLYPISE